jgi:hypothetical protein
MPSPTSNHKPPIQTAKSLAIPAPGNTPTFEIFSIRVVFWEYARLSEKAPD